MMQAAQYRFPGKIGAALRPHRAASSGSQPKAPALPGDTYLDRRDTSCHLRSMSCCRRLKTATERFRSWSRRHDRWRRSPWADEPRCSVGAVKSGRVTSAAPRRVVTITGSLMLRSPEACPPTRRDPRWLTDGQSEMIERDTPAFRPAHLPDSPHQTFLTDVHALPKLNSIDGL